MMQVVIQKTNRKDKKLEAVIDGKKTVPFGASGMSDYTTHKDSERKAVNSMSYMWFQNVA